MLLDSEGDIDKIQTVASELKNCIKSIEWDLEDLDQTISKLLELISVPMEKVKCKCLTETPFISHRNC